MDKLLIFLILLLGCFILPDSIYAALKINEIYPAPPAGEAEWIEVYNDGEETINLSSYTLTDYTGKQIKFSSTGIDPQSFSLATSSSVLNNDGDTVYLKNSLGEILHSVTYSENINSDKSNINCPDGSDSWFISTLITENSSNAPACLALTSVPSSPSTLTATFSQTPPPSSSIPLQTYTNIYLSEVMVDPDSNNHEWIEIFNNNDHQVSMTNWFIDDDENSGSAPKKFSLFLDSNAYGVIELSNSIFNNSGDSVRLLDFEQKVIDSFEYGNSEKGKSLGRISFSEDNFCLQIPSYEKSNGACLNPTHEVSSLQSTSVPLNFTLALTPSLSPGKTFFSLNSTIYPYLSQIRPIENKSTTKNDNILGAVSQNNDNKITEAHHLISSLTFVSFSYSFISIISVLLKLKFRN